MHAWHLKAFLLGLFVLCDQSWAVTFNATPPLILEDLTQSLILRCATDDGSIPDNTNVLSIGISFKEVNSSNLVDIAQVTMFDGVAANVADVTSVAGELNSADTQISFLEVAWKDPAADKAGEYYCDVNVMDNHGHTSIYTVNMTIMSKDPSLDNVVVHFGILEVNLENMWISLNEMNGTVSDLSECTQQYHDVVLLLNEQSKLLNSSTDQMRSENFNLLNEFAYISKETMRLNETLLPITNSVSILNQSISSLDILEEQLESNITNIAKDQAELNQIVHKIKADYSVAHSENIAMEQRLGTLESEKQELLYIVMALNESLRRQDIDQNMMAQILVNLTNNEAYVHAQQDARLEDIIDRLSNISLDLDKLLDSHNEMREILATLENITMSSATRAALPQLPIAAARAMFATIYSTTTSPSVPLTTAKMPLTWPISISFRGTPSLIVDRLTSILTLRCDIDDVVTSDPVHVLSIAISREEANSPDLIHVAQVTTFDGASADTADVTSVAGDVHPSGIGSSFLEVSWKHPSLDKAGEYLCVVGVMDRHGHADSFTVNATVLGRQPSVEDVAIHLNTLQDSVQELSMAVDNTNSTVVELFKTGEQYHQAVMLLKGQDSAVTSSDMLLNEENSTLHDTSHKLAQEIVDLNATFSWLVDSVSLLNDSIMHLKKGAEKLNEKITNIARHQADTSQTIQDLKRESAALVTEHNTLENKRTDLLFEMLDLLDAVTVLNTSFGIQKLDTELMAEAIEIHSEVHEAQLTKIDNITSRLDSMTAEMDSLDQSHDELRQKTKALENSVTTTKPAWTTTSTRSTTTTTPTTTTTTTTLTTTTTTTPTTTTTRRTTTTTTTLPTTKSTTTTSTPWTTKSTTTTIPETTTTMPTTLTTSTAATTLTTAATLHEVSTSLETTTTLRNTSATSPTTYRWWTTTTKPKTTPPDITTITASPKTPNTAVTTITPTGTNTVTPITCLTTASIPATPASVSTTTTTSTSTTTTTLAITFMATPPLILEGVTETLTLACEVVVPESLHVLSLVISRKEDNSPNFVYVAQVTSFDGVSIDMADVSSATGKLNTGSAKPSFLEVSWKHPSLDKAGEYRCEMGAMDSHGHTNMHSVNVSVSGQQISLENTAANLNTLEDIIQYLLNSLKEMNNTAGDLVADCIQRHDEASNLLKERNESVNSLTWQMGEENSKMHDRVHILNEQTSLLNKTSDFLGGSISSFDQSISSLNTELVQLAQGVAILSRDEKYLTEIVTELQADYVAHLLDNARLRGSVDGLETKMKQLRLIVKALDASRVEQDIVVKSMNQSLDNLVKSDIDDHRLQDARMDNIVNRLDLMAIVMDVLRLSDEELRHRVQVLENAVAP